MAEFITSDLHLGHEKMAGIRKFGSVVEHDMIVIHNWNQEIRQTDTVYVLGDVLMGDRERGLKLLKTLHGKKHLILGNHDRPAPNNRNGHNHIDSMGDSWESITTSATYNCDGVKWLMSHYPYDGDHTEEQRFDQWRLRDLGAPLLHGHTHSSEKLSFSDRGTVQVHVGLDAWRLRPIPIGMAISLAKV